MLWAKRLLSACLALAFAGFSLAAAAPVHAHDAHGSEQSPIHVIALDDHHEHDVTGDHHDDGEAGRQGDDPSAPSHGPMFHCHSAPAFSPVEAFVAAIPVAVEADAPRIASGPVHVTGGSLPPLRPPRAFL